MVATSTKTLTEIIESISVVKYCFVDNVVIFENSYLKNIAMQPKGNPKLSRAYLDNLEQPGGDALGEISPQIT